MLLHLGPAWRRNKLPDLVGRQAMGIPVSPLAPASYPRSGPQSGPPGALTPCNLGDDLTSAAHLPLLTKGHPPADCLLSLHPQPIVRVLDSLQQPWYDSLHLSCMGRSIRPKRSMRAPAYGNARNPWQEMTHSRRPAGSASPWAWPVVGRACRGTKRPHREPNLELKTRKGGIACTHRGTTY